MIELNYRPASPVYEQIMDGIRRLIVTGSVERDEKLPSVRELAAALTINPTTIARAYRELEAEGYVYSVNGKGTFVADAEAAAGRRTERIWKEFDRAARELLYLSVPAEALEKRVARIKHGGVSEDD